MKILMNEINNSEPDEYMTVTVYGIVIGCGSVVTCGLICDILVEIR